jgi:hypothetical protein
MFLHQPSSRAVNTYRDYFVIKQMVRDQLFIYELQPVSDFEMSKMYS